MSNLFNKAKASDDKKVVKTKEEKSVIKVEDLEFFEKVSNFEKLQTSLKKDKAVADKLSEDLKSFSKSEWVKLYEKNQSNPGTIIVECENEGETAKIMYTPSDKYLSIDDKKAEKLIEEYGPDIIEEKVTFSLDEQMIEKYGEVISRLIEECEEINESDKDKIIKATTTLSITKGTIDKMLEYGEISKIVEVVKPVMSLKSAEIIKG